MKIECSSKKTKKGIPLIGLIWRMGEPLLKEGRELNLYRGKHRESTHRNSPSCE